MALCLSGALLPQWAHAADSWGGSLAVTSDYLVRGISHTGQGAALQGDLHVATDSGLLGGLFASNARFESYAPLNAEISAFVGFAWQTGGAWRSKVLASYYGYAGSHSRSYDYAEFAVEADYDDWLDLELVYSPDTPRYISSRGLTGVSMSSAEVNVRTPWNHHLAAIAGVGYSQYGGAGGGGYAYWSAGGVVDLAPWSLSVAYVNTSAEAGMLFYSAAAHNQWTATAIWRF